VAARLLPLALCAPLLAACPGGGNSVPESDGCREPPETATVEAVTVESIEAGPLADDDVLPLTTGGQGTDMIGLRIVLTGADVPECMGHETTLTGPSGTDWGSSTLPLRTYGRPDGSAVSGELWLFPSYDAYPGELGTLRTESYGAVFEADVWIDMRRPDT